MELKPYQQQVITDIGLFLAQVQATKDVRNAFNDFWSAHPRTPLLPSVGQTVEPYKNNVPRVPHICVKVPTAGGKTFIACNALKTIFDAFDHSKTKAVVWLVPSVVILEQTVKNLRDPSHPYRQKINTHFGNKVEVFEKATLLQGTGFNASSVKEQLNIMVFSFDSLRARNKEDRKVFQENGNLQSFESLLPNGTDITLGEVIKHLNPVVVVDESHNAESELSVEMLKELNPSFILDLTATPRKNSNIVSFIDALELKRENMVKLPVIVYNHQDKTEVINSALQLQKSLEVQAKEEEKKGGRYIRPIVLFQVQPKSGKEFSNAEEERINFQKLKEMLVGLKIPAEQIKIKTANINEIKGIDLMSKSCEVRYIITINALKEGWDCPFAYVLATLADKSSAVDVEQILGRILRQPYVMKHNFALLNVSYVLTASSKFLNTLDNIVKGLNRAGYSEKDYRLGNAESLEDIKKKEAVLQLSATFDTPKVQKDTAPEDITEGIDLSKMYAITEAAEPTIVAEIAQQAIRENEAFEQKVATAAQESIPTALQNLVKTYPIKEVFLEQALQLALPQFYKNVPTADLFGSGSNEVLLEREYLLEGFLLGKADTTISFDSVVSELYKIDLDESKKEHTPTFVRLDGDVKKTVMTYFFDPSRKDSRVKHLTKYLMGIIGNMYPISDKEIEKYITRVLEDFSEEQFQDFANNEYTYADKIKQKITALSEAFAEKQFKAMLDTDKVFIKNSYKLPLSINPSETAKDITKSLYEKEGKINGFEERVINEIANLNNVLFWTRNPEKRGFKINGFINHYPDFIIQTKKGKTVLLETKGDHLDAESKIRLGSLWEKKAGNNYRYYVVYDRRIVDGAKTLEEFLDIMKEM